jgi:FkbM family methyltransferase
MSSEQYIRLNKNEILVRRTIWRLLLKSGLCCSFPHGFDVFFDIRKLMYSQQFNVVFDVGANEGQSLYRISHAFPRASIYCFEPVRGTFNKLRNNTKRMNRVQCFPVALGSVIGTKQVRLRGCSLLNSLSRKFEPISRKDLNVETVRIDTLNNFCKEHSIGQIDYLKIDTEGFDLEVLKGGYGLLSSGRILFIQVEAGLSFANEEHIPFQVLRKYLEDKNYVLFGIYDQTLEWSGDSRLNFCNAVFLRST